MIIFGFGSYFSILSHAVRLHVEWNTHFNLFGYEISYNEQSNGVSIAVELLKLQVFVSILSNCQDLWFNTADSSLITNPNYVEPDED